MPRPLLLAACLIWTNACGGSEEELLPSPGGTLTPRIEVVNHGLRAVAYRLPSRGESLVVAPTAGCPTGSKLINPTRSLTFPAGAVERVISSTAKTICFGLHGDYHCHVSGTSTGFCDDWGNNFGNAVKFDNLDTTDGRFVLAYVAARATRTPRPRFNVSGHSQGGADAAQVASLLRQGDQLTLLQPAAAALYAKSALHGAIQRGAVVNIAWTAGDEASISIEKVNALAKLPLIKLGQNVPAADEGCGVRLHNAPNARHLFHHAVGMPTGYTVNPALDASVISNPGSPCQERGNIALSCPASVPWRCPAWVP